LNLSFELTKHADVSDRGIFGFLNGINTTYSGTRSCQTPQRNRVLPPIEKRSRRSLLDEDDEEMMEMIAVDKIDDNPEESRCK
jgi:hypothetical protein